MKEDAEEAIAGNSNGANGDDDDDDDDNGDDEVGGNRDSKMEGVSTMMVAVQARSCRLSGSANTAIPPAHSTEKRYP